MRRADEEATRTTGRDPPHRAQRARQDAARARRAACKARGLRLHPGDRLARHHRDGTARSCPRASTCSPRTCTCSAWSPTSCIDVKRTEQARAGQGVGRHRARRGGGARCGRASTEILGSVAGDDTILVITDERGRRGAARRHARQVPRGQLAAPRSDRSAAADAARGAADGAADSRGRTLHGSGEGRTRVLRRSGHLGRHQVAAGEPRRRRHRARVDVGQERQDLEFVRQKALEHRRRRVDRQGRPRGVRRGVPRQGAAGQRAVREQVPARSRRCRVRSS